MKVSNALRMLSLSVLVAASGVYVSACHTGEKQEASDQMSSDGSEEAPKKDKKKKAKGKKHKKKDKAAAAPVE